MKNLKSTFALGLVFFLSIFLISCSEEPEVPTATLDEADETSQEIDLTTTLEDVDEVVLVGFQRNGFSDRTAVTLEDDLCRSVNIEWQPDARIMTIDFGEGCTGPKGITRSGKIIVKYTGRYWVPGSIITTTFENYFVNERQIEGTRTVENEGFNEEGLFFTFTTMLDDGKITWPDGTFRETETRHIKRTYLPNGDRGIIHAVSGRSRGVNRNGNSYQAEISSPLIFAQRCLRSGIRIPSAGVLSIDLANRDNIEIDFGDEGCDREVTITRGDQERTITLPRS